MSDIEQIKKRVDRTDQAARHERLKSPELVQRTKAVRHSGGGTDITYFYCKIPGTYGSTGSELKNVLYNFDTHQLIPASSGDFVHPDFDAYMYCYLAGPSPMGDAAPYLQEGTVVPVQKLSINEYIALQTFIPVEDCAE